MLRITILFLPLLLGFAWTDSPGLSVGWSLAGSLFIAGLAQTEWFQQSGERVPVAYRLLRPGFMFHFSFVGFHVLGGAFHALGAAGYESFSRVTSPSTVELQSVAAAQQLMLLAHAATTAGMRLAGFQYGLPRYTFPRIRPYALIVVSFLFLVAGLVTREIPGMTNLYRKFLDISTMAVLLELAISIRRKHFNNAAVTLFLVGTNVAEQLVSGWKAQVLGTAVILGALLYPMMRRTVLVGGVAFAIFWAFYIHPFGMALRPLLWYQGVEQETSVATALDAAVNMSLDDRLSSIWTLMTGRANDLTGFRRYMDYVPGARPYYGAEILKEALIAFVPRFVWPDKPDLERLAMERVYDAGLVSRKAIVSAKANFYQDAYLSGGWLVVLVASLICGIVMMVCSRLCERWFGGYDIGTCLIYTSLFATAFHLPSSFLFFLGNTWGSLLTALGLLAVGRLVGVIVPVRPDVEGGETRRTGLLPGLRPAPTGQPRK